MQQGKGNPRAGGDGRRAMSETNKNKGGAGEETRT